MAHQPIRKPQLVRKRAVVTVPKTVNIVVQPSKNKAVSSQQLKRANRQNVSKPLPVKKPIPVQPPPVVERKVAKNVVSKQKLSVLNKLKSQKTNKSAKVRYVTRNVSPEDTAKANALRNKGKGKVLIMVGNGPSIAEVPLEQLKNKPNIEFMSINKPDDRIWPTDYWAFYDGSQIRRHENYWSGYTGTLFNSTSIKKRKDKTVIFKNIGGKGFSLDVGKGIHIGRSSVYASMQIALWMDFDKIFIFGCDMNPDGINGQLHFYGVNPDVPPEVRKNRFKDEADHYNVGADAMNQDQRNKFVFCSEYNKWGFIEKFGSMSHKEAVMHILETYGDKSGT
jgi:hypothetical protein